MRAANETQFGAWRCLLTGATVVIQAAGWLEGGLTVSYEKLITDLEVLQMVAELCAETPAQEADIGPAALEEVQPGGHFFGAAHTMERYQTAFYEPLIGDLSNFGIWQDRGAVDTTTRATGLSKECPGPPVGAKALAYLRSSIRTLSDAGGTPPES